MARSNRKSPAVVPFREDGGRVSYFGNKAMRLFVSWVREGVPEEVAWEKAGDEAFRQKRELTKAGNCHLVSPVPSGYTGNPRNGNMTKMATKVLKKQKSRDSQRTTYNRGTVKDGEYLSVPLPAGDDLEQWLARGIARIALRKKLTIPQLATESGLPRRLLYRLLEGNKPQTAAANLKKVCEALEIDKKELEALGTPPP